jgi:hypothetical protein
MKVSMLGSSTSAANVLRQALDSAILSDFPENLARNSGRPVLLLWRGTRDGFDSQEFYNRCDGHPNTLTEFLDMDGNTFGGFTPVES